MKTYLVGGAVRDELLGLTVSEYDYVVVGATQDQMLEAGYIQVGADFPVFLHPESKDEYALARTERKQGNGYKGFVFATMDVTLEQDLLRRDLTINAIAQNDKGVLFDPYGGVLDLQNKVLRHVSDAFAEDPVRILRVARFAARFADLGFSIAPETLDYMKTMVDNGEVNHLVPERVAAEMFKALDTAQPQVFFEVLRQCGALRIIMPEVDALFGVPQRADYHPEIDTGIHVMMCLADAAKRNCSRLTRYGVLCHDLGKATTPTNILPSHHGHESRGIKLAKRLSQRLKLPRIYRDMGMKTAEFHTHVHKVDELKASTILKLLKSFSGTKSSEMLTQFVDGCISDSRGRLGFEDTPYPQAEYLLSLASHLQSLNTKPFIQPEMSGEQIGEAIRQVQINTIKTFQKVHSV